MRWVVASMLVGVCLTVQSEEAELPLERDWYRVELIIIDHQPGLDENHPAERLSQTAPRQYPAGLWGFRFDDDTDPGGGFAPATGVAEPFPEPQADFDFMQPDPETPEPPPLNPDEPGGEISDAPPELILTPEQQLEVEFTEALAAYEASLLDRSHHWSSRTGSGRTGSGRTGSGRTGLMLAKEAARLRRTDAHRVLMHGAWIQSVPERDAPEPVLLQSDEPVADRWRIEGTLAVTLGRYLHVAADLWFQDDLLQDTTDSWVALPSGDRGAGGVLAGIPFDFSAAVDPSLPYLELSERRRMRSGETHYLDHPRFGLLIRVDPVEAPIELRLLFEQLNEGID